MSKEKQIEEMEKIIADAFMADYNIGCDPCPGTVAEALYLENYRKQSEWISVEERLPEVRQRVLLYSYHDGVTTGYRADEIGRFYVDKSYPYRPTYWMPLPEAPKGGAE
jgi:membrane-bound lytic murein transglycosylase MltF